jgi:hypothetical protein
LGAVIVSIPLSMRAVTLLPLIEEGSSSIRKIDFELVSLDRAELDPLLPLRWFDAMTITLFPVDDTSTLFESTPGRLI